MLLLQGFPDTVGGIGWQTVTDDSGDRQPLKNADDAFLA